MEFWSDRRVVGFRAKTPFEEGWRKTVQWYAQSLEALSERAV